MKVERSELDYSSVFQRWHETILDIFGQNQSLCTLEFPKELSSGLTYFKQTEKVEFDTNGYSSEKLSLLRRTTLNGGGYNVYNLVAIPKSDLNIPILGFDTVLLPGGALCAFDFQPLEHSETYFSKNDIYRDAKSLLKWRDKFPEGGEMKNNNGKYFSPFCLWTRFDHHTQPGFLGELEMAIYEYTRIYAEHLNMCKQDLSEEGIKWRKEKIKDYFHHRITHDPARNILVRAFGKDWTESALSSTVFPLHIIQ